jgi:glycerol-3-phosphate acyltransferase PlsY
VLGHVFPVTRRFKGGRGVATGGGVMLVIFPLLTLALTALWIVLARLTHKASIASITVAIAFPIAVALAGHEAGDVLVITVMALLVVGRHLSNLRRLVTGRELGLEGGRQSDEPPDVGDERAAS